MKCVVNWVSRFVVYLKVYYNSRALVEFNSFIGNSALRHVRSNFNFVVFVSFSYLTLKPELTLCNSSVVYYGIDKASTLWIQVLSRSVHPGTLDPALYSAPAARQALLPLN